MDELSKPWAHALLASEPPPSELVQTDLSVLVLVQVLQASFDFGLVHWHAQFTGDFADFLALNDAVLVCIKFVEGCLDGLIGAGQLVVQKLYAVPNLLPRKSLSLELLLCLTIGLFSKKCFDGHICVGLQSIFDEIDFGLFGVINNQCLEMSVDVVVVRVHQITLQSLFFEQFFGVLCFVLVLSNNQYSLQILFSHLYVCLV